jgi:hypothetical protein
MPSQCVRRSRDHRHHSASARRLRRGREGSFDPSRARPSEARRARARHEVARKRLPIERPLPCAPERSKARPRATRSGAQEAAGRKTAAVRARAKQGAPARDTKWRARGRQSNDRCRARPSEARRARARHEVARKRPPVERPLPCAPERCGACAASLDARCHDTLPLPARGRREGARLDDRALRIFATRPTAWRSHPSPFVIPSRNAAIVIPSRNPLLSTRAAGEESPPLATLRSLVFARDDDGESFQAQGEESAPLATPGSLALLGMTEPVAARAKRNCGVAVSRACVTLIKAARLASDGRAALRTRVRSRPDRGSTGYP